MRSYMVTVHEHEFAVRPGPGGEVSVEGYDSPCRVQRVSRTEFSVIIGDRQVKVIAAPDGDGFDVIAGGFTGNVRVESERDRLLRKLVRSTKETGTRREIHAPMPAMVVKLNVSPGDGVTRGQSLIVLEAMKMENEIKSSADGCVKKVYAVVGKPVEKGELLLLLE